MKIKITIKNIITICIVSIVSILQLNCQNTATPLSNTKYEESEDKKIKIAVYIGSNTWQSERIKDRMNQSPYFECELLYRDYNFPTTPYNLLQKLKDYDAIWLPGGWAGGNYVSKSKGTFDMPMTSNRQTEKDNDPNDTDGNIEDTINCSYDYAAGKAYYEDLTLEPSPDDSYVNAIRTYIEEGGTYIGTCAGAYFASQECHFPLLKGTYKEYIGYYGLNLFSGTSVMHGGNDCKDVSIINNTIFTDTPNNAMVLWMGPHFANISNSNTEILGYYPDDYSPAVIKTSYGQGKVLLMGTHAEALTNVNDPQNNPLENTEGYEYLKRIVYWTIKGTTMPYDMTN